MIQMEKTMDNPAENNKDKQKSKTHPNNGWKASDLERQENTRKTSEAVV